MSCTKECVCVNKYVWVYAIVFDVVRIFQLKSGLCCLNVTFMGGLVHTTGIRYTTVDDPCFSTTILLLL